MYLITQAHVDALRECLNLISPLSAEMLISTFKPIEPLDDATLLDLLMSIDPDAKRCPPGFKAFARAIEKHILGENE